MKKYQLKNLPVKKTKLGIISCLLLIITLMILPDNVFSNTLYVPWLNDNQYSSDPEIVCVTETTCSITVTYRSPAGSVVAIVNKNVPKHIGWNPLINDGIATTGTTMTISSASQIAGTIVYTKRDDTTMASISMIESYSTTLHAPWFNEISPLSSFVMLQNVTGQTANVSVEYRSNNSSGSLLGTFGKNIPPYGGLGWYPSDDIGGGKAGSIKITSNVNIGGVLSNQYDQSGVDDQTTLRVMTPSGSTTLYVPRYQQNGSNDTWIIIKNLSGATANMTFTFRNSSGGVLGTSNRSVSPYAVSVSRPSDHGITGTGSLTVTSNTTLSGIWGYAYDLPNKHLGSSYLLYQSGTILIAPKYTGAFPSALPISYLNLQNITGSTANIVVKYDSGEQGTTIENRSIPPYGFLRLEPPSGNQYSGHARITSNVNLVGVITREKLAYKVSIDPLVLVSAPSLTISTGSLATATVGNSYSQTLSASGGFEPYTWSLLGSLPADLSLNTSSGTISGTPTLDGTQNFTIRVTDDISNISDKGFSITVDPEPLEISAGPEPVGTVGQAYSYSLTGTGGVQPYSWSVSSGTIPPGLSINPTGSPTTQISGTPTVSESYIFTVEITDNNSNVYTKVLSITINPAPFLLIADINFADPNLAACVNALGLTYAYEVTSLNCNGQNIGNLTGIEQLTSLTYLDLFNNSITDISSLGSLTSLTNLYLSNNSITGVSALGSLTSLTTLDLSNNSITGVSALGSLTSLTSLSLNNNSITDVSALGSLTSLTSLSLSNNSITDVSALGSLTSLTNLYLSNNSITGVSSLGSLTSLTNLYLSNNSITDVSALGSLTSLTTLDLPNNSITDVSALGSLTSLTTLSLSNNSITDVSALGSLTSLTYLSLNKNSITDVSTLGSLTSLTTLDLPNNSITDVSALGSLTSLTNLYLYNNSITDVSALGSLTSLTYLYLDNNSITDVSALGSLTSLTTLDLPNNSITDVSALGSLTSLTSLSLSNNSITDVSALGSLTSLTYLYLNGNSITTGVASLTPLTSANTIDLSNNNNISCADLNTLEAALGAGVVTRPTTCVAANTAPTATITAPANGSTYTQGDTINFTGTGSDPEDGTLSGTSLSWSSNLDDTLGTGSPLATASLTVGTHAITLTATDSGGLTGTNSITVTIEPAVVDTDGDGVNDNIDQCPDTPASVAVDDIGCAIDQIPPGEDVPVTPIDGVTLTFGDVSDSGTITVTQSGTGTPPPSGFKLGSPPTYYNITTTAVYSGYIYIRIDYNDGDFSSESSLKLFHRTEGGDWENVTCDNVKCADYPGLPGVPVLPNPNPDTVNNFIIGRFTSFSEFALFEEDLDAEINIDIDIKPGSDTNAIKLQETGNIPVAIFGSGTFNVSTIDVESLRLNAAAVWINNGKKIMYSFDDINSDGITDMLAHFDRGQFIPIAGEEENAVLTGNTSGGTNFTGSDSIKLIDMSKNNTSGSDLDTDDDSPTVPLSSDLEIHFNKVKTTGNTSFTLSFTSSVKLPNRYTFGKNPKFYDLNTTAGFTSAEVCITYDETEYSSEEMLKLLHYETGWDDVTTSLDTSTNTVCGTVSSFSPFVVGQKVAGTAVSLSSFTAAPKENSGGVLISWRTGSEINNEGFNILRSESPEGGFVKVNTGLIMARGSLGGASYQFTDSSANPGSDYFYRLEDIDNFGNVTVSYLLASTGRRAEVIPASLPDQTMSIINNNTAANLPEQKSVSPPDPSFSYFNYIEGKPEDEVKQKGESGLLSFTLLNTKDGMVIKWSAADKGISGFNILKAEYEDGQYLQVNDTLIEPLGDGEGMSSYSYVDKTAGDHFYYRIEVIRSDGSDTVMTKPAGTQEVKR